MPRGRHRHSPPLHKLLPPTAVAGAAVLCAAGAWLFADPLVLRGLVAATAVAALTGAVVMRGWDRSAGRRVAELARGRESDHWKTEERVAELEADVEESRELRGKLDAKLRAKRVELAKLRGEHAALLRRYATAETERATALEGRRQLALEAAAEPKALTAASSGTATAAAYLGAARALDELARNGAAQQARRTVEAARARDLAERATEAEDQRGKHAAAAGAEQHSRPASALPATRVPTASAIVPYSTLRRPVRPEAGFDFFGAESPPEGTEPPRDEAPSGETEGDRPGPAARLEREDLADVVGEEALAERRRSEDRGVGQVIDLTAHDETERFELGELRGAVGS
ncbi:hypothetical protein [Streptomyces sp. NBC_01429]|uniref:hypothetical protein n=1 Tax=Streptomyces sp. NBC_01429 TaxID=2903862 RepID=UPI002E2DE2AE|nr:hypothetical protein [Streptomyces sp. NBC_01429]